jgi:ATP adenylyltransferase
MAAAQFLGVIPVKRLWAPWRMAYIEQQDAEDCIFCLDAVDFDLKDKLILYKGKETLVMLNKFPYNNGHLLVAPRRHMAELDELSPVEMAELSRALQLSVTVLKKALNPQGFNLGMNLGTIAGAGVAWHLHYHIVPRWKGDTNFMPVLADVRVVPEHLDQTYERLIPFFKDLGKGFFAS